MTHYLAEIQTYQLLTYRNSENANYRQTKNCSIPNKPKHIIINQILCKRFEIITNTKFVRLKITYVFVLKKEKDI